MALPQRYSEKGNRTLQPPKPGPGCCESRESFDSYQRFCERVGIPPMPFEKWAHIRAKQERQRTFQE
jgi:hypothetical protein